MKSEVNTDANDKLHPWKRFGERTLFFENYIRPYQSWIFIPNIFVIILVILWIFPPVSSAYQKRKINKINQ